MRLAMKSCFKSSISVLLSSTCQVLPVKSNDRGRNSQKLKSIHKIARM